MADPTTPREALGRVAYEAAFVGGAPVPWELMVQADREDYCRAAKAVASRVRADIMGVVSREVEDGCGDGQPSEKILRHIEDEVDRMVPAIRAGQPAGPTTNLTSASSRLTSPAGQPAGPVPASDRGRAEGDMVLAKCGDDAMKWAEEFRRTAVGLGYSDMDVGWLVGWFANAIMHSQDVRRWRQEAADRESAGQPSGAGSEAHAYTSTACHHGLHARCRQRCKFCSGGCSCDCHPPSLTEGPQRPDVYTDVMAERARQDAKWGGPEHDDEHGVKDWANYIGERQAKLRNVARARSTVFPRDRQMLIEIAALAVAAVESLDRWSR